ncbi:MAG: hypothetical protein K2L02_05025 [Clostridia bacterium]|nr:hypothetical protein [Clostridia bacterium]
MKNLEKIKDRESELLKAFNELIKEKEIGWYKAEIENQLKSFILYLKKELRPNQRIFENLESRIKSADSFREKIHRNGYLQSWDITDDRKHNKELIATNLSDLIGFRITCFFLDDEEDIYCLLKKYYHLGKFKNITINFNKKRQQQNGHIIYKVSGIYNKKYSFELQIKSIMHNIWGEVEHKTVYKNNNFDPNLQTKKAITEDLFKILQASDRQLLALFNQTNTEEKILQSLFFEKTKEKISKKIKTNILAKHYERFFNIFSGEDDRNQIKDYVITILQGEEYSRKPLPNWGKAPIEEELKKAIQDNFYEYDLMALFHIANLIYRFGKYENFLCYLGNLPVSKREADIEVLNSVKDEFDDPVAKEDPKAVKIKNKIYVLTKKIGRVKESKI